MKSILSAAIICLLSFQLSAQQQHFDWVETQPVQWNLNPSYPRHLVTTDGLGRNIASRFLAKTQLFGSDLFGNIAIEARDATDNLETSYPLTGKVEVDAITADAFGNIYVAGAFMKTMHLGTNDSMVNAGNTADSFNVNAFLLKINVNGFLVWKRNMELTHTGLQHIDDIEVDASGNGWYAWSEWMTGGHLVKLDANGNDTGTPLTITGVNGVSSFSFDPQNNVYLTGSASNGTVQLGSLSYTLTEPYNTYLARFDNQGNGSWVQFAKDVTFQRPVVVADRMGNAILGGTVMMDSTAWGIVHLHAPQWVYDFFVVKADAQGNFLWGKQTPHAATIQGDVQRGSGKFVATDSLGNAYFLGNLRGNIDWGNGVTTDAGPIPSYAMAVICFGASDGTPLWSKTGGYGSQFAQQLAIDNHRNIYFTQNIEDTTHYDSLTFDIPMYDITFVLGKISTVQDTTGSLSTHEVIMINTALYPNPSSAVVCIPYALQGSELRVLDALGRQVATYQNIGSKVNVEKLPSGCYLFEFTIASKHTVGRLIKE